jgi:hypothetical protein
LEAGIVGVSVMIDPIFLPKFGKNDRTNQARRSRSNSRTDGSGGIPGAVVRNLQQHMACKIP